MILHISECGQQHVVCLGNVKLSVFIVSCSPSFLTPSNPWKYSGNYQCIIADSSFLLKGLSYKNKVLYRKHFLVLQVFLPYFYHLFTTITVRQAEWIL